jgi:hypothetical protein
MIGADGGSTIDADIIKRAADKAAYKSLAHAAASIRKYAMESIEVSTKPGPAGGPVRARPGGGGKRKKGLKGKLTGRTAGRSKKAILFASDKQEAVIGFAYNLIGRAMESHERGVARFGTKAPPKRPTMALALEANAERYAAGWADSIED